MQQIRVGWRRGVHAAKEPWLNPTDGGPWLLDTAEHRDDAAAMIRCGNDVCGEDTHWLEERTLTYPAAAPDERQTVTKAVQSARIAG